MAAVSEMDWPWQYNFPPFFTIQPHSETRVKQQSAWRSIVLDFYRVNKLSVLDIREAQNSPLFYNSKLNRKLPMEGILLILDDLARTGNAEPLDKLRNRWLVLWRTAEEWGKIIYDWVQSQGLTNTVCTLYELVSGDDTVDQGLRLMLILNVALRQLKLSDFKDESHTKMFRTLNLSQENLLGWNFSNYFHGLDTEILIRALRTLGQERKAEIIGENEGVKFF